MVLYRCDGVETLFHEIVLFGWLVRLCCLRILVDPASVTFLETLAPKFSTQGSVAVRRTMNDGILFLQNREEAARSQVLDRILNIPERIPSLFTFSTDTKYLEPCAKSLKLLFPSIRPRSTSSLRETSSRHCFRRQSP